MNKKKRGAPQIFFKLSLTLAIISFILAWIPEYNFMLIFTIGLLALFGFFSLLFNRKSYSVWLKVPLTLAVISVLIAIIINISWQNAKAEALSHSSYQEKTHQKMEVGQTVQIESISYKINWVKFMDQLPNAVPDNGQQFIMINVTLTNHADKDYGTGKLDYLYKTTDFHITANHQESKQIQSNGLTTPLQDGSLPIKNQVTGNLYAQVPKDSQVELSLSKDPNFKTNSGHSSVFTYILNKK